MWNKLTKKSEPKKEEAKKAEPKKENNQTTVQSTTKPPSGPASLAKPLEKTPGVAGSNPTPKPAATSEQKGPSSANKENKSMNEEAQKPAPAKSNSNTS